MKKEIWFKAKTHCYGWYPCCLKGWLIMILYALLLALSAFLLDFLLNSHTAFIFSFLIIVLILTIFLWIICKRKGEPPIWKWSF